MKKPHKDSMTSKTNSNIINVFSVIKDLTNNIFQLGNSPRLHTIGEHPLFLVRDEQETSLDIANTGNSNKRSCNGVI